MKKMKKKITTLIAGAVLVAAMVIGMAGSALAGEDTPTLSGTINYDKLKTITLNDTYYDVCKILFENNSAEYSKTIGTIKDTDLLAEFLNDDFADLECTYYEPTIEFYYAKWDELVKLKDVKDKDTDTKYAWEFLNRKVDKDTIIKFGYVTTFEGENNPIQKDDDIVTYVNGKEVEHEVFKGATGWDKWEEALGTDKAVGLEVYDQIIYPDENFPPITYAYFNVGKIGDVLSPENPQTSDSNNTMIWFSLLGIAVLAGTSTVIYRKARKNN